MIAWVRVLQGLMRQETGQELMFYLIVDAYHRDNESRHLQAKPAVAPPGKTKTHCRNPPLGGSSQLVSS